MATYSAVIWFSYHRDYTEIIGTPASFEVPRLRVELYNLERSSREYNLRLKHIHFIWIYLNKRMFLIRVLRGVSIQQIVIMIKPTTVNFIQQFVFVITGKQLVLSRYIQQFSNAAFIATHGNITSEL